MQHPNRVLVYESTTGQTHSEVSDFWPRMNRHLCGSDEDTPPSHRFRNTEVDLTKCPELLTVVRKHGGGRVQNLKQRRITCDQDHGLLALTLSFFKQVPGLRDTLLGQVLPTDSYASVCDAYAIYVQSLDTVLFVDSVDINNFAANREWGFWFGSFNQEGSAFYYEKQNKALKYDLSSGRIDTLYGFTDPVIPSNSMAVLGYNSEDETLALTDNPAKPVLQVVGHLGTVWSAYAMSDSVFLVAASEPTERPLMTCWLYDFTHGSREKLFLSEYGQILQAEWIDR